MTRNKIMRVLSCLLLAAVLAIMGCGASSTSKTGVSYNGYYAVTDGYEYAEDIETETKAAYEASGVTSGGTDFVRETDEKLVYTCRITIETLEFETSLNTMNDLISKYEGYIESEEQRDDSDDWYYSDYQKTHGTLVEQVSIRIPTKNYDAFLRELSESGNVRSRSQSVENITTAYRDTETTIQSLKIQEQRLLEMMEKATDISDMITVEDRLSDVQNELAMYQNRLNGMDQDVAYSTIDLTLQEVMQYTPEEAPKETFLDRLKYTVKDSWDNTKDFAEGLLFFLIYALPVLLILGVIALIIFLIIRASVKSSRKKRARKIAAYQQAQATANENKTE